MGALKVIIGLVAAVILILLFLSWRLEFGLPFISKWNYFLTAFIMLLIVLLGRILANIMGIISGILWAVIIFSLLFSKETGWSDYKPIIIWAIIAGAAALVLYLFGSESFDKEVVKTTLEDWDDSIAWKQNSVVCASCDQYLGKTERFDTPCPRCDSNRYNIEE